jgi:hypothetical protein
VTTPKSTTGTSKKKMYRVRFQNEGRIFEIYAREVTQGTLFGFVEIAELVWGTRSSVIIDPSEQELRNEFAGVTRVHVPMHAVVRIDEVEKGGTGKILALPGAAGAKSGTSSPTPIYTPPPKGPGTGG